MIESVPVYDSPKNPYLYKEELISKGNDFEVYGYGEDYVIKIPHSPDSKSSDFYNKLVADHEKMKEIFGDNLAESNFLPPEKTEGGTYRIIQQRFQEDEFLDSMGGETLKNFILNNKEMFKTLLEKAKIAKEMFGVPVDLTPHNIVFHNGKLLITENDSPTFRVTDGHYGEKITKDNKTIEALESLLSTEL
jgi:hypothetical protein